MDMSYPVNATTIQTDLFGRLPGAQGGRATRDRYGRLYLHALAQRGGHATRDRYGLAYLCELARRGGIARRFKEDTVPRTIHHWDGTIQRLVPYRRPRSRRRRPEQIRIELDEP
jgi:hypothetical protein